ncbi:uncharacterized protein LY89DRAFT_728475 [Mollisia scopiformis]|uniref:Uncharacterized protein n=1 Tax=Mollisia scopiformis TaxID=149040 RepID=A0A194XQI3_MOLSC|nr:uncharacterized protein LY89DRAFT_728475 [Mollisia scopiformis]KUJ22319.1 hypothetical protein LY89DRAFT_728475 [Mollisia scopiformis]
MDHPTVDSSLLANDETARDQVSDETRMGLLERWLEIVNEFTKLEITYELDRLPAISGIASYFQTKMNSSYNAGIWQYNLGHGLLWRKMPYQISRRIVGMPGQYIPSWSWASVELLSRRSFGMHTRKKDLIIDASFHSTGPTLSRHEVKSIIGAEDAALSVQGLAIFCTLTHQHEVTSDIYPTHLLNFRGETEYAYTDITCNDMALQESIEVACLLIGETRNESVMTWDDRHSGSYIIQFALILQSDSNGIYTRVGLSEHDRRKAWFMGAETTAFEIL